jgi:hypothetical protein
MLTSNRAAIALAIVGVLSVPIVAKADSMQDWIQGYFVGTNSDGLGTDQPQVSPAREYGTPEPLTQQQTNVLQRQELRFPQSRQAVTGKLGYANAYDADRDYYDLADGKRVAIFYSGATAVSIEGLQ